MNDALVMILNWNGFNDTVACIESISESPTNNIDYMIFDNGSDNNSFDEICSYFIRGFAVYYVIELEFLGRGINVNVYTYKGANYYVCPYPENLGFAKACNAVANFARSRYKTIIFLNNDTIVSPNTFSNLHTVMELHNAKIVIPQIRFFDRPEIIWNCGGEVTFLGKTKYYYAGQHYSELAHTDVLSVGFATGCCVLFDLDFFITVGGYSERFFFGEEDVELSLRLRGSQVKIICDLHSLIYHKVGASLSGNKIAGRKGSIHILNRLINMRNFIHPGVWHLWAFAVCLRFYFSRSYKFPRSWSTVTKLYLEASRENGVSKERFQDILKNGI